MLKINSVEIYSPKDFEVTISDLDGETNRNAQAELIRDRIAVKRKLNCGWGPLNSNEMSILLKSVSSVFFTVEFPDPQEGTIITRTMYVGDRTSPSYYCVDGEVLWLGLKMNLIER